MTLTPREYEVARLFATGLTWEQVMHAMGTSRRALHMLRSRAMTKAGAGTMQELWAALGWLVVPLRASGSGREPFRGGPAAGRPAPSPWMAG